KIWDTVTGKNLQTLEDHVNSVSSFVVSADGQWLASVLCNEIKIWDVAVGACLRMLDVTIPVTCPSFYAATESRFPTEVGIMNPDLLPVVDNQLIDTASESVSHSGYGISHDGTWVVINRRNVLWLPPEYRASASAVVGSTVAIGCRSGHVLVI
ncbi:hypothetical protein BGZ63DRAFT_333157, partial [Mariannaea sp. PMI_226]